MREEYMVKIERASDEFSGKQAVMLKDLSDAVSFLSALSDRHPERTDAGPSRCRCRTSPHTSFPKT